MVTIYRTVKALQLYSWGFALIKFFQKRDSTACGYLLHISEECLSYLYSYRSADGVTPAQAWDMLLERTNPVTKVTCSLADADAVLSVLY